MDFKKKISLMIVVILIMQIIIPVFSLWTISNRVIALTNDDVESYIDVSNESDTSKIIETIEFGTHQNNEINDITQVDVKSNEDVINDSGKSEAFLEWNSLTEEGKAATIKPREEFVDIMALQNSAQFTVTNNGIPEKYNLKDVLDNFKLEQQGFQANCYAYAALNSIETNIALKTGVMYDFSEMHAEYMTSNLLGGARTLNSGGNFQTIVKYSKDLQGPVLESEIPNRNYSEDEYNLLKNAKPIVTVTETVEFPTINKRYGYFAEELEEFRDAVKNHIMTNGSVYASIYFSTNSKYYNSSTYGYSCLDTSLLTNHAVSIIGWDDTYLATNFPEENRPANNGAWIALNSWGQFFGNNGLFYISYEDNWVEYNMSGIVSTTEFVDTYGPRINLTNYSDENNTITAKVDVVDIGGNGIDVSKLKYQWSESNEQPTVGSFIDSFEIGETLSKTYTEGEKWYLWILAYDTKGNFTISGAVRELIFTDKSLYNALCYVLEDKIISGKENENGTFSIYMTQNAIDGVETLKLCPVFDYPAKTTDDEIKNIEEIEVFKNLKILDLSGNQITNIDNIKALNKLQQLSISNNKFTKLEGDLFPESLTSLSMRQNRELKIINTKFPENLEYLDIEELSSFEDWETLEIPQHLKCLNIITNNLEDKIENMNLPSSLEILLIGNNNINNIDCLSNLVNLKRLCIGGNNISDISVIENFSQLEKFSAGKKFFLDANFHTMYTSNKQNSITNISDISLPDTLDFLDLSYNKLTEISNITWPTNLEYLYLNNNLINNISMKVNNINSINLSYNEISDISNIDFTNTSDTTNRLAYFNLMNNNIKQIDNVNWNTENRKIHTLILAYNKISNIDNVVWPEGLDSLSLSNNNITTLNNLSFEAPLRIIQFNYNNIDNITNITWPTTLKAIEIVDNKLSDLDWVKDAPSLISLAIFGNKINDIHDLVQLNQLQEIHAERNNIEDVSPLEEMDTLKTINMESQLITKVVSEDFTFVQLPQIITSSKEVDSKVYTDQELILRNCNVDNERVIFDSKDLGHIMVIICGGNADGTVFLITNVPNQQMIKEQYLIENGEELTDIAYYTDYIHLDFSDRKVELTKDIDLGGFYNETTQQWEGNTWIPIGNKDYPFSGVFEGNNHKITGMYINSNDDYKGLIGYNNGTIQNLTIEGYICGEGKYIGGLCGESSTKDNTKIVRISNIRNLVEINTKGNYVGGICGSNSSGIIENCSNLAHIETEKSYIGGIVGENRVGFADSTKIWTSVVKNSYNSGEIIGNSDIGGICGDNSSFNHNTGFGDSIIVNCFNTGNVSGDSTIGGILGKAYSDSVVEECYNIASVTSNRINIKGSIVGVIVKNKEDKFTIKNCYYLDAIDVKAINNKDDEENNVYGLTDDFMKSLEFVEILNKNGQETNWKIGDNNYSYPMLEWQEYTGEPVTPKNLVNIEITTPPTKTNYIEGQNFDKTGMVVTAIYEDETRREVKNYKIEDANSLTIQQETVTISYTENNITKETTQKILVDHDFEVEIVEPTCTEDGYTLYTCKICGFAYYDNVTEALGHEYENGVCIRCGEEAPEIYVSSEKYSIDDGCYYIEGVGPKTTVQEIIDALTTNATEVKLFDKDGEELSNLDQVGTRTKVYLKKDNDELTFTIIVKGDIDGNGEVDFWDMLAINKYRLGLEEFEEEDFLAGDITGDAEADFWDMLEINKFRLGLKETL